MSSARGVTIGTLRLGGGAPVRVESMLKSRLEDPDACLREVDALDRAGCELVRAAFPRAELRDCLRLLCARSTLPIMADIHFSYRLAIEAVACGCAAIRINPGNMGGEGLLEVLDAAREKGVVIRIGANGGSLSHRQIAACDGDRAAALATAVEEQLAPLVERGFADIILSAKSSSVRDTIRANQLLAQRHPYPLHIGITEAGPGMDGAVKSATGLGVLLAQGIGDTIRVSLTGPSRDEVDVGYAILRALDLRKRGVELISCPTCGRRRVEVVALVERVRRILPDNLPDGTTVAVMGCEVNGPKEAAGADIGIAGTEKGFVLFRRGEPVATGTADALEEALGNLLKDFLP